MLQTIQRLLGWHPPMEQIAGLRDQVLEIGTHVRFLEADRPVPQPRDSAGRFVSKFDLRRDELIEATKGLTPEQRAAAKARAEIIGQGR